MMSAAPGLLVKNNKNSSYETESSWIQFQRKRSSVGYSKESYAFNLFFYLRFRKERMVVETLEGPI